MANEFDTVSERDLGGLGAGRRIAAVRAVDDVGQSINATPEQIAALTGMDYSKLIEQEVPGEKWLGPDGVPRQVYVRTFTGTITNAYNVGTPYLSVTPITNYATIIGVQAMSFTCYAGAVNTYEGMYLQNANGNIQLILQDTSTFSRLSQPFLLTIKYIYQ